MNDIFIKNMVIDDRYKINNIFDKIGEYIKEGTEKIV